MNSLKNKQKITPGGGKIANDLEMRKYNTKHSDRRNEAQDYHYDKTNKSKGSNRRKTEKKSSQNIKQLTPKCGGSKQKTTKL